MDTEEVKLEFDENEGEEEGEGEGEDETSVGPCRPPIGLSKAIQSRIGLSSLSTPFARLRSLSRLLEILARRIEGERKGEGERREVEERMAPFVSDVTAYVIHGTRTAG